ncbi:MAG: right-handed parallel beta-helix repeat-containing protein [Nitrospirae bacterium]|nr:right-handed parallel beta-helix repeat-containing protein [Candidatus Manganitrophaceae bacterium]
MKFIHYIFILFFVFTLAACGDNKNGPEKVVSTGNPESSSTETPLEDSAENGACSTLSEDACHEQSPVNEDPCNANCSSDSPPGIDPDPVVTPTPPSEHVFRVGPTRIYRVPSEVASIVPDGALVEIDAGVYSGDVAVWNADNLTIRGVGGMAHLRAEGANAQGKGTWIINGKNTTLEYIEFSGSSVPGGNGAGIRHQGGDLTIRYCFFHDNENGILTDSHPSSHILIEYSEFASNGYGDGFSHNMYIGNIQRFTFQHNYSHHAKVGHNLKSRARENFILYNRIMDEASGISSYAIDLPNGGLSVVMGNVLQQGPDTGNSSIVSYAAEGGSNPSQVFYFVNNTVINDRSAGKFVQVSGTPTLKIINNLFAGAGNTPTGSGISDNLSVGFDTFVDTNNYDYRLIAGSPAIDTGVQIATVGTLNLSPVWEYVHRANRKERILQNILDIGAHEF